MTTAAYQAKILSQIARISSDIDELKRVEMEIATAGNASASISAGGGSKSFTRQDLGKIAVLIQQKEVELAALRARLNGQGPIRRIMFVR